MLFDKINNGSHFGVIREVFSFSPQLSSPQLRQFLNNKCHFIGFVEIVIGSIVIGSIVIGPIESLFFVYENEPSTTFNLKNFLLVLAKYIYSEKICYCENKQDKNTHNMKSIEFLSTGRHDFGKDLDSIDVELSNPNTFVQSLLKLGSFLHGKTIESFDNPKNYMDDKNLKDLKKLLSQDQINLSNAITMTINNANAFEINFINTLIFSINEGSYTLTGV